MKTIVIKYGGNAMTEAALKKLVAEDIAALQRTGVRVIVVHGGGPEITGLLSRLNIKSEFVAGLRVTDQETMTAVEMALVGKTNPEVVNLLNMAGVKAVGLNGKDAGLLRVRRHAATVYESGVACQVDIGFVGEVEAVDTHIINLLLESGYVPVIAPTGADDAGCTYNINADTVAAAVAGAMQADIFLLLTDVEGIYRDFNDKNSFISKITAGEAVTMIKEGSIGGGMIPKVEACLDALNHGSRSCRILDGRIPHVIFKAIAGDKPPGTAVIPEEH